MGRRCKWGSIVSSLQVLWLKDLAPYFSGENTDHIWTSTLAKQFLEFGFGEDGDAEFFGFVVFRAGVGADDDVVGFFADGAGEFAAVLLDEFAGFFAGAIGEAASEDEGFSGELLAFDFALFGGGMHAGFVKLFDELAIRWLGEEFDNGGGNFGADFVHCLKLLFLCGGQLFQRGKLFGKQLARSFAYGEYSQRINQARQAVFLAAFDFFKQVLRGLFGHAVEGGNFVFFQGVKIGDIFHEAFVYQLIDDLVAEAIDIHGVAAG